MIGSECRRLSLGSVAPEVSASSAGVRSAQVRNSGKRRGRKLIRKCERAGGEETGKLLLFPTLLPVSVRMKCAAESSLSPWREEMMVLVPFSALTRMKAVGSPASLPTCAKKPGDPRLDRPSA